MLRFFRHPDMAALTRERDALAGLADTLARDADRLRADCAELHSAKMELARQLAQACQERDDAMAFSHVSGEILTRRTDALRAIAAQETSGANATVQRMARMAREALE